MTLDEIRKRKKIVLITYLASISLLITGTSLSVVKAGDERDKTSETLSKIEYYIDDEIKEEYEQLIKDNQEGYDTKIRLISTTALLGTLNYSTICALMYNEVIEEEAKELNRKKNYIF